MRTGFVFYTIILILSSIKSNSSNIIVSEKGMDASDATSQVSNGDGAINEKIRHYQPNNGTFSSSGFEKSECEGWDPKGNLAHLLHALIGLDRYPNYLGRFRSVADIDLLESALESQLSVVRSQRSEIVQRRIDIHQLVKRYTSSERELVEENNDCKCSSLWSEHPLLSTPKTWLELRNRNILTDHAFMVAYQSMSSAMAKSKSISGVSATAGQSTEFMDSSLGDIMNGKVQVQLRQSLLEDFLCQEMFDVYSFPLLSIEFCALLRETIRNLTILAESDKLVHLGRRPIDLNEIGLEWITDLIFQMFVIPISRQLFVTTEELSQYRDADDHVNYVIRILDWRQGYVAGYSANPSERTGAQRNFLVPHTDDSEVTLNCCLGEVFTGGNVEFYGLRGTHEEGKLVGTVHRPNVGTAIIHSGRHLHSVSKVSSGERYALIVWSRSWGNLRSITCPCCWLNRRRDSTCICGKRWN